MDDNILRMYIDQVFSHYDKDKSGTLDKRQLVDFFNQLFQSFHDPRRVDQNTINQMLTACNMNHDGQMSKPELFELFKRVLQEDNNFYPPVTQQQQHRNYGQWNQGENMDDNILQTYIDQVFSHYDKDKSGTLDKRQLARFFKKLFKSLHDPRKVDQNTINQMLTACDMDHDGQINKLELFVLLKKMLMGDNSLYPPVTQKQQGSKQF